MVHLICCSKENLFDNFFKTVAPWEFFFEKSILKSPPITMVDLSLFSRLVIILIKCVEKLSIFLLGGIDNILYSCIWSIDSS